MSDGEPEARCAHCGASVTAHLDDLPYRDAAAYRIALLLGVCLPCYRLRRLRDDIRDGHRSDYPGETQAAGARRQLLLMARHIGLRRPEDVLLIAYSVRYLPAREYAAWRDAHLADYPLPPRRAR